MTDHVLGMDQDMARQIRAIQAGMTAAAAFEEREHIRASETEPLLAALDGLFHEVTDQNKQLKQLNATLEQQVALRTRQLSEANRALEALSQSDSLTGSWMWLSDAGQPSTSSIVAVQCGVAAVEASQLMLGAKGLRRAHARAAVCSGARENSVRSSSTSGARSWQLRRMNSGRLMPSVAVA
jgi:nitrate/nitrite-specific signal transduction histidine kinase